MEWTGIITIGLSLNIFINVVYTFQINHLIKRVERLEDAILFLNKTKKKEQ